MMVLRGWLNSLISIVKESARKDMHRMACGWSGRDLPIAPIDSPPPVRIPSLSFSLRSRQKLGWMGFVIRNSH